MPIATGTSVRLVILNDQGRYETISLEELIERADNYVVDAIISHNLQDKYLLHYQSTASSHWLISYNFGPDRRANVILFNDNFEEIKAQDIKVAPTQVDVYFQQPIIGYAILN